MAWMRQVVSRFHGRVSQRKERNPTTAALVARRRSSQTFSPLPSFLDGKNRRASWSGPLTWSSQIPVNISSEMLGRLPRRFGQLRTMEERCKDFVASRTFALIFSDVSS